MKYEGIVEISNDEYHGQKEHLSSSNYKLLLKDVEAFYEQKILGKRQEHSKQTQTNFDEGTLAHSLILEPHLVDEEFRFFEGMRKQGKLWEEFKHDPANEGFILLSKAQRAKVKKWVDSYKKRPEAVDLVSGGFAEHTLFGEFCDIPTKVRADYINIDRGYIADVKTTSGPTDVDSWKYTMDSFGYQLSAALYAAMFEQYYEKKFDFYFIVLGKRDFNCEVFKLSDKSREKGINQLLKAARIYKERKKSGDWTNQTKKRVKKEELSDYEILEV